MGEQSFAWSDITGVARGLIEQVDYLALANDILEENITDSTKLDQTLSSSFEKFINSFYSQIDYSKPSLFEKMTSDVSLNTIYKILAESPFISFKISGVESPASLQLAQFMVRNPIFMKQYDVDRFYMTQEDRQMLANNFVEYTKSKNNDPEWLAAMKSSQSAKKLFLLANNLDQLSKHLEHNGCSNEYSNFLKHFVEAKIEQLSQEHSELEKDTKVINVIKPALIAFSSFIILASVIILTTTSSVGLGVFLLLTGICSGLFTSIIILGDDMLKPQRESDFLDVNRKLVESRQCLDIIKSSLNRGNYHPLQPAALISYRYQHGHEQHQRQYPPSYPYSSRKTSY